MPRHRHAETEFNWAIRAAPIEPDADDGAFLGMIGATLEPRAFTWWAVAGNVASATAARKLGYAFTGAGPITEGFRGDPTEGWFAERGSDGPTPDAWDSWAAVLADR